MSIQSRLHRLNPTFRLFVHIVTVSFLLGLCSSCFAQQTEAVTLAQRSSLQAEMDDAIEQVKGIVNQPVTILLRASDMEVSTFRPGWFHEGASKPDFNTVDVRKTQDTATYGKHQYVTSDVNPGLVFRGSEVEFNSMTKYFYTDRSLPKKKLTEEEMLEINRLYRIIGHCEQELAKLQKS